MSFKMSSIGKTHNHLMLTHILRHTIGFKSMCSLFSCKPTYAYIG